MVSEQRSFKQTVTHDAVRRSLKVSDTLTARTCHHGVRSRTRQLAGETGINQTLPTRRTGSKRSPLNNIHTNVSFRLFISVISHQLTHRSLVLMISAERRNFLKC